MSVHARTRPYTSARRPEHAISVGMSTEKPSKKNNGPTLESANTTNTANNSSTKPTPVSSRPCKGKTKKAWHLISKSVRPWRSGVMKVVPAKDSTRTWAPMSKLTYGTLCYAPWIELDPVGLWKGGGGPTLHWVIQDSVINSGFCLFLSLSLFWPLGLLPILLLFSISSYPLPLSLLSFSPLMMICAITNRNIWQKTLFFPVQ